MNIEAFKSAIDLGAKALSLVKNAKDLLPNSPQKQAADKTLDEAEKAFRIAESQAAKELGYNLCQCTWPPQIMLFTGKKYHFKCPKCGYALDTSPVSITVQPKIRRSRFKI